MLKRSVYAVSVSIVLLNHRVECAVECRNYICSPLDTVHILCDLAIRLEVQLLVGRNVPDLACNRLKLAAYSTIYAVYYDPLVLAL